MNIHRLSAKDAGRSAIAALVLAATLIACVWIAEYKDSTYNHGPGLTVPAVNRFTPGWGIPVAILIGVGGAALALVILRSHRARR